MEGMGVTIARDSLAAEKGLETLERQRKGGVWFGGGLRTRASGVSQSGMQERAGTAPVLLEKQEGKKANIQNESQETGGRVEVPSIQTTAGRDGKLIQGQQRW